MLFDIRNPARRRTIQAVYLMLAVLIGGGLIFFGIGNSSIGGGLLDAFNGGSGSSTNTYEKAAKTAAARTRANPRDKAAWATLTRARYQLAGQGENYDQQTGTFTDKGLVKLALVEASWDRYLSLAGSKPDAGLAALMVQAFAALNKSDKAAEAAEIVAEARPSPNTYAQLATFAYQAGQSRKGDLAAKKAVALAPKDQREVVKAKLKAIKANPTGTASG